MRFVFCNRHEPEQIASFSGSDNVGWMRADMASPEPRCPQEPCGFWLETLTMSLPLTSLFLWIARGKWPVGACLRARHSAPRPSFAAWRRGRDALFCRRASPRLRQAQSIPAPRWQSDVSV